MHNLNLVERRRSVVVGIEEYLSARKYPSRSGVPKT